VTTRLLVLRPEPGASETAERARLLRLDPIKAPLFTIRPLAWEPPDPGDYDAVLLTSANAPRHGGPGLQELTALPCFAVGEATGMAAREAGFKNVRIGPSDGAAAVAEMARAGIARALHLCGRDHIVLRRQGLTVQPVPVYGADPVEALSVEARGAIDDGAVVLLHSPRAARRFAELVTARSRLRLAAISDAVAEAAGDGWAAKEVAPAPRDEALLELAARLCNYGAPSEGSGAHDGP